MGLTWLEWCHKSVLVSQTSGKSTVCSKACLAKKKKKKDTSKLRIVGPFYEWNPSVTGRFPSQRASNTENASMSCRLMKSRRKHETVHSMYIYNQFLHDYKSHQWYVDFSFEHRSIRIRPRVFIRLVMISFSDAYSCVSRGWGLFRPHPLMSATLLVQTDILDSLGHIKQVIPATYTRYIEQVNNVFIILNKNRKNNVYAKFVW